jgi:hypothetical protein
LGLSSRLGGEPISDLGPKFPNIPTLRTESNAETPKRGEGTVDSDVEEYIYSSLVLTPEEKMQQF